MRKIHRVRVLDDISDDATVVIGDEEDEDAEVVEIVVDQRAKYPQPPMLTAGDHVQKRLHGTEMDNYMERVAQTAARMRYTKITRGARTPAFRRLAHTPYRRKTGNTYKS